MGQDTLRTSVPQIDDELAESLRVLAELEARLPAIRTQASQVRLVYDSGRRKVRQVAFWRRYYSIRRAIFPLLAGPDTFGFCKTRR